MLGTWEEFIGNGKPGDQFEQVTVRDAESTHYTLISRDGDTVEVRTQNAVISITVETIYQSFNVKDPDLIVTGNTVMSDTVEWAPWMSMDENLRDAARQAAAQYDGEEDA